MRINDPKGNGEPGPDKHRWLMKHSNGDTFETRGYYTFFEVKAWELSKPVKVIEEGANAA